MADPNHSNFKYEYLKALSMERLEELLTLGADMADDSENDEYIDAIVQEIIRREKETPTGRLAEVDQAWSDFQTYYNAGEGGDNSLHLCDCGKEHAPRKKKILWRRVSVAAAVLVVVLIALPVSGRSGFLEKVGRWTEDLFYFEETLGSDRADPEVDAPHDQGSVVVVGTESIIDKYDSVQGALAESGITANVVPTQLPEGYELKELYRSKRNTRTTILEAVFQRDEQQDIILSYCYPREEDGEGYYEKDGTSVQEYLAGGVVHYIFSNNEHQMVVWCNGAVECSIQADLEVNDIHKLIDSIYEIS